MGYFDNHEPEHRRLNNSGYTPLEETPGHLTIEQIRKDLPLIVEKHGLTQWIEVASWDQFATAYHDTICNMGLDPADKQTQLALVTSAFYSLALKLQDPIHIGLSLANIYIQCEVARRWFDDEVITQPLADFMETKALMALMPTYCEYKHEHEGGVYPCILVSHDRFTCHKVHVIDRSNAQFPVIREIEC